MQGRRGEVWWMGVRYDARKGMERLIWGANHGSVRVLRNCYVSPLSRFHRASNTIDQDATSLAWRPTLVPARRGGTACCIRVALRLT